MSTVIYSDLEYLYPEMTKESGRPSSSDLRQIVQIAAIKVDELGNEIDTFDILVKPTFTLILPDFFVELTNITQDQVDQQAITLKEAIPQFISFVGTDVVRTYHKDYEVWMQNADYIQYPFNLPKFQKVRELLPKYNINPDDYSSGTLYQSVGLNLSGHVHNALHDVRSMSATMTYLEKNYSF